MVSSINGFQSSYKGFSGLVSGMDTEGIIEKMMQASNLRLSKLYQQQQKVTWKTDAYRSVTSSLVNFSNKYLSSTSTTSMLNASFFKNTTITALGGNAGAATVTGSVSGAHKFQILGISQLASTSAFTSGSAVTNQANFNGEMRQAILSEAFTSEDFASGKVFSKLEGAALNLKVNGNWQTIALENVKVSADPLDQAQNISNLQDAFNASIKKAGLSDKLEVSFNGGKFALTAKEGAGSVELAGASKAIIDILGLTPGVTTRPGAAGITGELDISNAELFDRVTAADMKGKSFTFDLDGLKRTITFGDEVNSVRNLNDLVGVLQSKLDDAYKGKVQVTRTNDKQLAFSATDKSAILSVSSGDGAATGNTGFLGIDLGDANRLLRYDPLTDSNVNLGANKSAILSNLSSGGESINVNGTNFQIYNDKIVVGDGASAKTFDFAAGTNVNDIMTTINNAKVGATVLYNSTSDNFTVTASESGSLGKAQISGGALSKALFSEEGQNRVKTEGKDAKLKVSLDGGATETEVTRNTNSFVLDGLNVTLNSTFSSGDKITFSGKTNADDIVKNIKQMVEDYNKLIKDVNAQLQTEPDKKYPPLTSEQRAAMSESEIKSWDEKAKAGSLFGDSTINSLATDIRFALSLPTNGSTLSSIGITSSTDWKENGLLTVNEDTLRKAIDGDPDRVAAIFTADSNNTVNAMSPDAGVMTRLQSVMEKYTSGTGDKGLLINKAGHESQPLSMKDNSMYKEAKALDEQIAKMLESMKKEETKYYDQFSSLEMYINQMNAQSSWLTQQFTS